MSPDSLIFARLVHRKTKEEVSLFSYSGANKHERSRMFFLSRAVPIYRVYIYLNFTCFHLYH